MKALATQAKSCNSDLLVAFSQQSLAAKMQSSAAVTMSRNGHYCKSEHGCLFRFDTQQHNARSSRESEIFRKLGQLSAAPWSLAVGSPAAAKRSWRSRRRVKFSEHVLM